MFKLKLVILFCLGVIIAACNSSTEKNNTEINELAPKDARTIAKEAYIFGFPLMVNYKTMYLYSINRNSPEYKGEFNEKSCEARLFTPEDKAIVTPNSDTPYCMFWMDLRNEPQVITLPEIEEDRYYSFQLIDLYTHNFAYLGTMTTGNKGGSYLITPKDWEGKVPKGVVNVIKCETDIFFVVVRTQLMNPDDMENVKRIQDNYGLQSLSAFTGKESSQERLQDEFLAWKEGDQFTTDGFKYLDVMLKLSTPDSSEKDLRNTFARLGIGTEEGFEMSLFDEETQKAIAEGVKDGIKEIENFLAENGKDPLASSKIFGTRDFLLKSATENYQLEDLYLLRSAAAQAGLYGNSGFEAMYPSYLMESPGVPYDASKNNYTLIFEEGELPPVKAFWSLSIYDGKTQLFINNPLNRYLLNSSMIDNFNYNPDGSLTIYIQKDSPGKELESNWLPAPDGPFYCVMRLYGPEQKALEGRWVNPPLTKTN